MKLEWVPLFDSGITHAFTEDSKKSLCGLKFPRQLVLPYNLPEPSAETHCMRCSLSADRLEKKAA